MSAGSIYFMVSPNASMFIYFFCLDALSFIKSVVLEVAQYYCVGVNLKLDI